MGKLKPIDLFTNQMTSVLSGVSAERGKYEYGGVPRGEGNGAYPVTLKTYDGRLGAKVLITPRMLSGDGWKERSHLIGKQIRDAIWIKEHGEAL